MIPMNVLGDTGLHISKLCLGGNIFGHFTDLAQSKVIIERAQEFGINFIDTADVYSDGESERIIGQAISGNEDYWHIGTKVGVRSDQTPEGLGRPEKVIEACEKSLKRLGIEVIDLYQLHNFDPETPLEDTLGAILHLKNEGKIRAFGISNYDEDELFQLIDAIHEFDDLKCVTLQNPYNPLAREAELEIIPACLKAGISFIPYNVLARGVLTGKYKKGMEIPKDSRAASSESVKAGLTDDVLSCVSELENLASNFGMSLVEMVLGYMIQQPGVITLPIGIRTIEQLEENVRGVCMTLSDTLCYKIEEILGEVGRFKNRSLTARIPK